MASGVPVVAPDAGGPRELVHHARTGYLVPPEAPAPLRAAVVRVARRRRAAALGSAGPRRRGGAGALLVGDLRRTARPLRGLSSSGSRCRRGPRDGRADRSARQLLRSPLRRPAHRPAPPRRGLRRAWARGDPCGARVAARIELLPSGVQRITLPAPRIPGTGGYRLLDPWRVERLLADLGPDHIEVSDRLTLRGLGPMGRTPRRVQLGDLATSAWTGCSSSCGSRRPWLVAPRTGSTRGWRPSSTSWCARRRSPRPSSTGSGRQVTRVPFGVDLDTFTRCAGPAPATRAGPGCGAADGALRPALAGEAPRPEHRDRRGPARGRDTGPAGRCRRRAGATSAGAPGAASARHVRRVPQAAHRRRPAARHPRTSRSPPARTRRSAWPRSRPWPAARPSWRPGPRPWPRSSGRVVVTRSPTTPHRSPAPSAT